MDHVSFDIVFTSFCNVITIIYFPKILVTIFQHSYIPKFSIGGSGLHCVVANHCVKMIFHAPWTSFCPIPPITLKQGQSRLIKPHDFLSLQLSPILCSFLPVGLTHMCFFKVIHIFVKLFSPDPLSSLLIVHMELAYSSLLNIIQLFFYYLISAIMSTLRTTCLHCPSTF